ncbi:nitroreductase family deazaflavin-dependent oxidoreductase [Povalibacter sp.]|uniref:nitroreductase family deazaflavin-dependent oxidoreductase n=1 Tax=Povalibacter sp. TaxID=1962978 RepID=UPI002F416B4E
MSENESVTRQELPKWIVDHLHRYAESPEKGHLWDATAVGGHADTPTLLLTTTGRKSGRQLTMPLIYGRDGDRYVIVASKGGAPQHPAWYLNLQANPEVTLQVIRDKFPAVARTATGEERERLWKMMSAIYPPYPSYQERTDREIPVVVLERK